MDYDEFKYVNNKFKHTQLRSQNYVPILYENEQK